MPLRNWQEVSPEQHGLAPQGDGDVGKFLNADGYYTSPLAIQLIGNTLAPNVLHSSLTRVGTLESLTVTAPIVGSITGAAGSIPDLTGPITSDGVATTIANVPLHAISELTPAANKLVVFTGPATAALIDVTAAGAAMISAADAAAQRALLGIGAITEAMQSLSNNTTHNVSTTKHGYAPKGDGNVAKFLNAAGTYSIPASSDADTLDGHDSTYFLAANVAIVGATKTKITYDADGLVTAGADATTADIADSSNKRYVTDAQLTVIGNTSGTNTGDQTSVTGNAGTITVADAAADTTCWVALVGSQTGNQAILTDAGISYNASTNKLTVGDLYSTDLDVATTFQVSNIATGIGGFARIYQAAFEHFYNDDLAWSMSSYRNGAVEHNAFLFQAGSGTYNTPTAITTGATIGRIRVVGYDGVGGTNDTASIAFNVSGVVSAGIVPGEIVIGTQNAAGALTTALTISNAQVATFANPIVGSVTGSAATLTTPRNINGVAFDGSANITISAAADAGLLTGATLAAGVTASALTSFGASIALGTPASGVLTNCTGTAASLNVGSAATLTTPRNINGVAFNGSANITVTAAGSTLTGTSLAAAIVTSSLTSFGASIALGTPASGVLTNCSGTASSLIAGKAVQLNAARTINGTSFNGTANITVTAAGSTLTGTSLAAAIVSSSLTSLGTITALACTTINVGGGGAMGALKSAAFTPTVTDISNIAALGTPSGFYIRVGNICHVVVSVSIDPTATGFTSMKCTLPIASNFTNGFDCCGVMNEGNSGGGSGYVYADTANDWAVCNFFPTTAAAQDCRIMFTYLIA